MGWTGSQRSYGADGGMARLWGRGAGVMAAGRMEEQRGCGAGGLMTWLWGRRGRRWLWGRRWLRGRQRHGTDPALWGHSPRPQPAPISRPLWAPHQTTSSQSEARELCHHQSPGRHLSSRSHSGHGLQQQWQPGSTHGCPPPRRAAEAGGGFLGHHRTPPVPRSPRRGRIWPRGGLGSVAGGRLVLGFAFPWHPSAVAALRRPPARPASALGVPRTFAFCTKF